MDEPDIVINASFDSSKVVLRSGDVVQLQIDDLTLGGLRLVGPATLEIRVKRRD